MAIIRNSAHCEKCGDDIESKSRHDFVSCTCGNIAVDGGRDYLRRAFDTREWTDTSIVQPDE